MSHVGYAKTLCSSLKEVHPEACIVVLLVDGADTEIEVDPSVILIRLEDLCLDLDVVEYITFAYSAFELSCAVRGSLFRVLLEDHGFERVIFLDSDIFVYDRLDDVLKRLETASFVLTPHVSRLYPNAADFEHELRMLLACGLFNAGFLGIRACDEALDVIRFLEYHYLKYCFNDHDTDFVAYKNFLACPPGWPASRYMFVDQLFLNLIPLCCKSAFILDDIAYNLGHWNLWQATTFAGFPRPMIDGRSVKFVHFSGCYISGDKVKMKWGHDIDGNGAKEQSLANEFCTLAEDYFSVVSAFSRDYRDCKYGFSTFDNAEIITPLDRRLYASMSANGLWQYGSPFLAFESFFRHQHYRASTRLSWRSRLRSFLSSVRRRIAR